MLSLISSSSSSSICCNTSLAAGTYFGTDKHFSLHSVLTGAGVTLLLHRYGRLSSRGRTTGSCHDLYLPHSFEFVVY